MLKQTSTETEPWTVIKSDNKSIATMEVLKIILNSVKYTDRDKDLSFNLDGKVVFSSKQELKNMKKN